MIMILFAQTVPAPQDLNTFLWIAVTVLAGVVAYLFRQLRKEEKRHVETEAAILEKALKGLSEVNETICGLADGLEAIVEQFSILREFDKLRMEIYDRSSKDS